MANVAKLPVIDLSAPDQEQVARDLVEAAVEHGFVYIKNTGEDIPVDAVDTAFRLSKELFASPVSEKESCKIQTNNRGWSGMHYETLDPKNQRVGDFKEAFNFGEFVDGVPQQPLPPAILPSAPLIGSFFDRCHDLCLKLNRLLGVGLAVDPPSFFETAHLRSGGASGTTLRFLYYPPAPAGAAAGPSDVRAGAHSDYGSLTLLFRLRGQAGLEIRTRSGGWATVPVAPPGTEAHAAPPILVNIGDLLSYWTDGLLRSTVHRVVFPGAGGGATAPGETDAGPRYSVAFFCHPVGTCALTPVPSERVARHAAPDDADGPRNPYAERKVLTADEHLQMRLRASYLQLYNDGDGEKS